MGNRLLVLAGPDEGKVFPLQAGEALLLGRSRATEGRLIDPHVSRVHCQVQTDGEHATLTDFDSAGGTFVNGTKIAGKQDLKPGDLIRVRLVREIPCAPDRCERGGAGGHVVRNLPCAEAHCEPHWEIALEQDPSVQGAFVAIDPATRGVAALVGGFLLLRLL